MGYNKILVPLDGSKLAEGLLRQVKTLAAPKAHVHLIHVIGDPIDETHRQPHSAMAEAWMTNPNPDVPESIELYETYLKRAGETLTLDGYWVTKAVRHGPIADAILQEARNGNFDVIAIARHSRADTSQLALGSVAQAVLAKAHCAVLTLPPVRFSNIVPSRAESETKSDAKLAK